MGTTPLVALSYKPETAMQGATDMQNLQVGQQQLRAGQQQLESGQMDIQAKQRAMADQRTIMQALAQNDGDVGKTLPKLAGKITPQAFQQLATFHLSTKKSLSEIDDNELKVQQDQHDRASQLFDYTSKLSDADYATQWPAIAQKNNEINPQHPLDPSQPIPKAQLPSVAIGLQTQEQYLKQEGERRQQQQANAGDWKESEGQLINTRTGETRGEKKPKPVDEQELQSFMAAPPAGYKATPAEFARWKASLNPQVAVLGNMIGGGGQNSALDQAAQRYSQSGELPAGFARSPGATAAIIKRSAELNPTANLAANKATFSADTASLKNLQKNFDQVSAFESTALKNLELYGETMKAIPDLGARFANTPLRLITGKMIGADNMAALNAARQTAAAEAAKVLSSANASGVLSDTQKKDAEDVLDGKLSYSATMRVINILKQDFANRHNSYADDIAGIKQRLGTSAAPPAAGGKSGGATAGQKILSVAAITKAAKDHNISVDEAKRQAMAAGYTVQ